MKDICIVCVRKIVGLQGMIYILCIYAFPMNISKYIWHKISHRLQGAFFTTIKMEKTKKMTKHEERK